MLVSISVRGTTSILIGVAEMEKLKALEEVCQPDVRYRNRVDLDLTTGAVSETTIQSIYRLIEPIHLSEKVPDDVRSHFEIAKNLALYSWYIVVDQS